MRARHSGKIRIRAYGAICTAVAGPANGLITALRSNGWPDVQRRLIKPNNIEPLRSEDRSGSMGLRQRNLQCARAKVMRDTHERLLHDVDDEAFFEDSNAHASSS